MPRRAPRCPPAEEGGLAAAAHAGGPRCGAASADEPPGGTAGECSRRAPQPPPPPPPPLPLVAAAAHGFPPPLLTGRPSPPPEPGRGRAEKMGNTTSCCVSSSPKLRRNAHSRLESYRPEAELSREDTGCNLQHISDRENIDGERGRAPGEPPQPFPSPPLPAAGSAVPRPLPAGWGRAGRSRCPGTACLWCWSLCPRGSRGCRGTFRLPELLLSPGRAVRDPSSGGCEHPRTAPHPLAGCSSAAPGLRCRDPSPFDREVTSGAVPAGSDTRARLWPRGASLALGRAGCAELTSPAGMSPARPLQG